MRVVGLGFTSYLLFVVGVVAAGCIASSPQPPAEDTAPVEQPQVCGRFASRCGYNWNDANNGCGIRPACSIDADCPHGMGCFQGVDNRCAGC